MKEYPEYTSQFAGLLARVPRISQGKDVGETERISRALYLWQEMVALREHPHTLYMQEKQKPVQDTHIAAINNLLF